LFYSSYAYIEARAPKSVVSIGCGSVLSNDIAIVSESDGGVYIGKSCVIGCRFCVYDSDFHSIHAYCRNDPLATKKASVRIGDHCFIGENVTFLKGAEIGDRSVVAAGTVVTGKFSSDVVIAGSPARVVKHIDKDMTVDLSERRGQSSDDYTKEVRR
jgi:maltose O-acetyltransferase